MLTEDTGPHAKRMSTDITGFTYHFVGFYLHVKDCLSNRYHAQTNTCTQLLIRTNSANEYETLGVAATPPKPTMERRSLSLGTAGSYFWLCVFIQLNIDSNVCHRLRFESETKCSESSPDGGWM